MSTTPLLKNRPQQGGYVLVAAITLVTVLLATGIAYMRWSTDESFQAKEVSASMQAYYLAQMGVIEDALFQLKQTPAYELSTARVGEPDREVPGFGWIRDIYREGTSVHGGINIFGQTKMYRLSAVGEVSIPTGSVDGAVQLIRRKCVLYVSQRTFADYMYLTNNEYATNGDRVKFQSGDTLQGRVHSNSQIAMQGQPVFFDLVTSTAADFWCSGCSPQFLGPDPVFGVAAVEVPDSADNLRSGAASDGHFIDDGPGITHWAKFHGASLTMYQWETGAPFDSTNHYEINASGDHTCVFVEGPLWLDGTVTGSWSIGASKTIRLMDNIRYTDSDAFTGVTPETSTNYLAIVSERQVKIANTPANGRENSGLPCGNGGGYTTNHPRNSIIITAAIVALGHDFTFENQNDADSGYDFGCAPDQRGTIYLYGSVTQSNRGYVHRSNRTSTGYLKQYRYDHRFQTKRPPCFFEAVDQAGRGLFNILQWGQGVEDSRDVQVGKVVRYN